MFGIVNTIQNNQFLQQIFYTLYNLLYYGDRYDCMIVRIYQGEVSNILW
jgi:hypothetical protein